MSISASECSSCGKVIIPQRSICPKCGISRGSMRAIELSEYGTLESYTVSQFPPSKFEAPITLGIVKLERNALVLALCNSRDIEDLEIGMEVRLSYDEKQRFVFQA
ncbi:hypothetical protein EU537_07090 [Candidatus Thorarchaeota archaeon]|nr:MAG: hypothetical protein EU537_07090 [Candidatus Thorarchaeota archaeon]